MMDVPQSLTELLWEDHFMASMDNETNSDCIQILHHFHFWNQLSFQWNKAKCVKKIKRLVYASTQSSLIHSQCLVELELWAEELRAYFGLPTETCMRVMGQLKWSLLQAYLCQGYKELYASESFWLSEFSTKAECMSVDRTLHRKEADYRQRGRGMEVKDEKKIQGVRVMWAQNCIQGTFLSNDLV